MDQILPQISSKHEFIYVIKYSDLMCLVLPEFYSIMVQHQILDKGCNFT